MMKLIKFITNQLSRIRLFLGLWLLKMSREEYFKLPLGTDSLEYNNDPGEAAQLRYYNLFYKSLFARFNHSVKDCYFIVSFQDNHEDLAFEIKERALKTWQEQKEQRAEETERRHIQQTSLVGGGENAKDIQASADQSAKELLNMIKASPGVICNASGEWLQAPQDGAIDLDLRALESNDLIRNERQELIKKQRGIE